jgi:hypothetical protein
VAVAGLQLEPLLQCLFIIIVRQSVVNDNDIFRDRDRLFARTPCLCSCLRLNLLRLEQWGH